MQERARQGVDFVPRSTPTGNTEYGNVMPVEYDKSTGCDIYSDCLTCPLPQCKHEESVEKQILNTRDASIVSLYFNHGYSPEEIGEVSGQTYRNIKRIIYYETRRRREGNSSYYKQYHMVEWKLKDKRDSMNGS
jgi:hypothetical protein|tara:strand:+ start:3461 stop:3862 length:402 start_codon:yes stop_codon:yes gene_type:complete